VTGLLQVVGEGVQRVRLSARDWAAEQEGPTRALCAACRGRGRRQAPAGFQWWGTNVENVIGCSAAIPHRCASTDGGVNARLGTALTRRREVIFELLPPEGVPGANRDIDDVDACSVALA